MLFDETFLAFTSLCLWGGCGYTESQISSECVAVAEKLEVTYVLCCDCLAAVAGMPSRFDLVAQTWRQGHSGWMTDQCRSVCYHSPVVVFQLPDTVLVPQAISGSRHLKVSGGISSRGLLSRTRWWLFLATTWQNTAKLHGFGAASVLIWEELQA